MHVKDAVRVAELMQCHHIHASAICMSKTARYFETPWNKPCGFDFTECVSLLRGKFHYDVAMISLRLVAECYSCDDRKIFYVNLMEGDTVASRRRYSFLIIFFLIMKSSGNFGHIDLFLQMRFTGHIGHFFQYSHFLGSPELLRSGALSIQTPIY